MSWALLCIINILLGNINNNKLLLYLNKIIRYLVHLLIFYWAFLVALLNINV